MFLDSDSAASAAEELDLPAAPSRRRVARVAGCCFSIQGVICRLCVESCPEKAIRLVPLCGGFARPEVIDEDCSGCGDCVAACPGDALGMKDGER